MGTTAQKLQNIANAKSDIASAITSKGGTVPTKFSGYGNAIRALPGTGTKLSQTLSKTVTTLTTEDLAGATVIPNGLFENCSQLTLLEIPSTCTQMGTIDGCSSLVTLKIPNGVKSNLFSAEGCTALRNLVLPGGTGTNDWAFAKFNTTNEHIYKNIVSLEVAAGTTELNTYYFKEATSLTTLKLPGSLSGNGAIGDEAFRGCTALTTVTLGNGITNLFGACFQDCTALKTITIPNSVTNLGSYCFQDCSNLVTVDFGTTRNTIPSCASGSYGTFLRCNKLANIYVPSNLVSSWRANSDWSSLASKIKAHP